MVRLLAIVFTLVMCSTLTAVETANETPTLYYSPSCGHCKEVLSYLRQNNKKVRMRNIGSPAAKLDYKNLGVRGVPVLVAEGRTITGSRNIIRYLETNSQAP